MAPARRSGRARLPVGGACRGRDRGFHQPRAAGAGRHVLDLSPGVGAGRKKALLAHFGSAKAVSRAGLEDLKAVKGISAALAEAIYGHFHPDAG